MNPALIESEVVDTMRNNHTTGQTGEIMIKRFERLLAVYLAIAIERSQELFLLGIDAQDRVASLEKLLDEMGQMAKLRIAMRRVAAGQHLSDLALGKTEGIENASHDARSNTDSLCLQAVGNLLGRHIRPHHVLAHGVTRGPVFDRVLHLLDELWLFGFRFLAATSWLADAVAGRIIGQLLELPHAVFDGLRVTPKDIGDVPGAAMSEFDRFDCRKAAAVLFREALVVLTQLLFDFWPIGPALSTSPLLDELPERRPMTFILVAGAWRQCCCATAWRLGAATSPHMLKALAHRASESKTPCLLLKQPNASGNGCC